MILFFDIETVPDNKNITDFLVKYPEQQESEMGLYPEFGKIVCISCGYSLDDGLGIEFKTKSFYGEEKDIISGFFSVLNSKISFLSGFNIVGFDMPFVFKRAIVNGIKIPAIINSFDIDNGGTKQPRKVKALDLMLIWKSTSNKFVSLDLLCKTLDIQSPKDNNDGGGVHKLYQDGKIEDIVRYCEGDVRACYDIWKKIQPLI